MGATDNQIFLFLLQLSLILILARGMGEVFRLFKQPPITAEILTGVILGPTLLGRFAPELHAGLFPADPTQSYMLETVSLLGIFFFLLATGLEIDFSIAWRQKGSALVIAGADIVVPMTVGMAFAWMLPDSCLADADRRLAFALFMATALTISAMPVAARALLDCNILKTELGFLIMSALAVNDIIGWVLFTLVIGLFDAKAFSWTHILSVLGGTIGFAVFALSAGRTWSNWAISAMQARKMPEPATSLTFVCLLGVVFGALTQKIGISALFGFFIAGIVVGEAKALSEESRNIIRQIVYAVFVPVFFASIGLKIDFWSHFSPLLAAAVFVVGVSARFAGAWIGVAFCNISSVNRHAVAVAHTPGGMMEVILGLIAFNAGLITEPTFVAIVFGGILSSIVMGPWLSFSLRQKEPTPVVCHMTRHTVLAEFVGNTRQDAIRELCQAIAKERPKLSFDLLFEQVMTREQSFGTAIGRGVAIPHARIDGLDRPAIAFGRSRDGIDWDSPDGLPCEFIFLIAVPKSMDTLQIKILAAIARAVQNDEMRKSFADARGSHDLWRALNRSFGQLAEPSKRNSEKQKS